MPDTPPQHDLIRRVVFEAPDGAWVERLRGGPVADAGALRVRRALGLPTDAAIVGTGHQPGAWHGGIAAKELAADAIVERLGEAGVAVVAAAITVDHQPAALTIRVPVRDGEGVLEGVERALPAGGPAAGDADRAVGWLPAFEPVGLDVLREGLAVEAEGTLLGAWHAGLVEGRGASSAAEQMMRAIDAVLAPARRSAMLRYGTSALAMTAEFGAFVRAMLDDAAACVGAYNAAARARPEAGIAPLDDRDDANPELPLWVVDVAGRSRRGYAADVAEVLAGALAGAHAELEASPGASQAARPVVLPRALAMTGFVRRYAADVFIHGTGGGAYDLVTEKWLGDWLGWRLAPMLVVTADVPLPIHAEPTTEADVARARWRAHHAKHNPGAVGDAGRDERKRALVGAIAATVADGRDAERLYAELHALLREHRAENGSALHALEDEALAAAVRLGERDLADDRAWAAALQTGAALRELRGRVAEAVDRAVVPGSGREAGKM